MLFKVATATGCGHTYQPPSPLGCGGSGYATSCDTGLTFCYPCMGGADRIELMSRVMGTAPSPMAMYVYVLCDGRVTNWPGYVLGRVVSRVEHKRYSMHGERINMTFVRVRDVEGGIWHGRFNSDNGELCSLRIAKQSTIQ